MTFFIRYEYETGNSFGREDDFGTLELSWENQEVARANLKRIQEHWEFYKEHSSSRRWSAKKTDIKKIIRENSSKDWFVDASSNELWSSLILKTDDGKDWRFRAPWCGYFEKLYGCSIIQDPDPDRFSYR